MKTAISELVHLCLQGTIYCLGYDVIIIIYTGEVHKLGNVNELCK